MANEMVRLNARVSKYVNDWLDKESDKTGVPKSTLIYLALETYINQKEAMTMMNNMDGIMKRLEAVEKRI